MISTIKQRTKSSIYRWAIRVADIAIKPNIFIIGAQKAGTSSLYEYLIQHPLVAEGKHKEISFFDQNIHYQQGLVYYHSQFPPRWRHDKGTLSVDASPDYLYYPETMARLYDYAPDACLIVVLRDPVERAYSSWNMYRTRGPKGLWLSPEIYDYADLINKWMALEPFPTFEEAIEPELTNGDDLDLEPAIIRRGIYHEQIKRVLFHFKREQLLVVDTKELSEKPVKVMQKLIEFLGLPPFDWQSINYKTHYQGQYESKIKAETEKRLRDFYTPHDHALHDLLGESFSWMD